MTKVLTFVLVLAVLCGCSSSSAQPVTALPAATEQPSIAPAAQPTLAPTPAPSPTAAPSPTTAPAPLAFSYPIGAPGRPLGDGFFIRHGLQTENTWYNPGYWHTGEDWYAQEGDTAGAAVYAIADGEVVYAGANYPGRVLIVQHAGDLVSMYGHLDPALSVRVGQRVARGEQLGTVLRRGDATPNHPHFEVRTFVTSGPVNGDQPRYPFRCGPNCPPGPGYWPISAPDLPSALGWRNPVHTINRRMLPAGGAGEIVVATRPASDTLTLWSAPPGAAGRRPIGELTLSAGTRYPLLAVEAGAEESAGTSALAYLLWYRIRLPGGEEGWAQAAVPTAFDTGSDRRPSSVEFNFFPTDTR